MDYHNPSRLPIQRSFEDYFNGQVQDERPLPLIAADRHGFPLQYYAPTNDNQEYLYSIQDWIAGVTRSDNPRQVWADLKRRYDPDKLKPKSKITLEQAQGFQNQLLESVQQLPYTASNGKSYQMDYSTDKTLYLITQLIEADTGVKLDITAFLAHAGKWADDWRLHPEKLLPAAERRMITAIERYEKAGLGNRPEVVELKARYELNRGWDALRSEIFAKCQNPKMGIIVNKEYLAVFGMVANELKKTLNTKHIRDSLPLRQKQALTLAEGMLTDILAQQNHVTNEQIYDAIELAIKPIGAYLRGVSDVLGIHHVTGQPLFAGSKS